MAATRLDLTVYYEDGKEVEVTADQRDIVVFERLEKCGFVNALDAMPVTLFRFLGYQALKRTGGIPAGTARDAWEATVVAVDPADEDDATVDPGQPEVHEVSSSASPLRRSRASGKSASGGNPKT